MWKNNEFKGQRINHGQYIKANIARISGGVLFIAGIVCGIPALNTFLESAGLPFWVRPALFIASWLLTGGEVIVRAAGNLFRGRVFDENFLMTIATIGAFVIGEFPEGAAVMIFYRIGEACQDLALNRSRSSITALMDLRPDYAMLRQNGETLRVSPESVRPGGIIVVRPGEKIALDGIVEEGSSFLDTSALTGESLPREVCPGSEVLSGMVNQSSLIAVRVTREAGESAAARILKLVREAEDKKAPVENFITRFARYYTPAVVSAAAALATIPPALMLLAAPEASFSLFSEWFHRALVFLVVSCPCALVVSIPLSFFGGIGGASRRGILVKGGNYLDALNRVDAVVFDKTGTLTRGFFTVTRIIPAPGRDETGLLRLAALAESNSSHPIALSIRREAAARGIACTGGQEILSYSELAGRGVQVQLKTGQTIRAGSLAFCEQEGGSLPPGSVSLAGAKVYAAPPSAGQPENAFGPAAPRLSGGQGSAVHIAENGDYAGVLLIADELKPDSRAAVERLKKSGIKTVMFTGDSVSAAAAAAAETGIDEFYPELLPWEKLAKLEELETRLCGAGKTRKNRTIVFAGDGINDAPVLARSGVGIAMGGLGSDAAIESADIVLMTDEPGKIIEAIAVAKKTLSIVRQNIALALGVKAALLVLGALGSAGLWAAVFGDVGVALIAVLNAARAYSLSAVPKSGILERLQLTGQKTVL